MTITDRQPRDSGQTIALGITLGVGVGSLLGVVLVNPALGVGVGAAIGAGIGAALIAKNLSVSGVRAGSRSSPGLVRSG